MIAASSLTTDETDVGSGGRGAIHADDSADESIDGYASPHAHS